MRSVLVFFLGCVFLSGCMHSANTPAADIIRVRGIVNVYGAEPFTAVVLRTEERNSWVLELSHADRTRLMMPARVQVTGAVYADEWNGSTWAHLRVTELVLLDE